jgi:hypothetical protein
MQLNVCNLEAHKPVGVKVLKTKNIQNSNRILCFCFGFEDCIIDFFYNHDKYLPINSLHKGISNFDSLLYGQIRYL